jgi:hypothetical protein
MGVEFLEVGFAFPYSDGCTPDGLRSLLLRLAAAWPGWHSFPWRVTRNMHHLLRGPEAKFSYLMMQRCLTGYAAHLVLTAPFEDRDAVLRMMAKTRFEVGGLLLDLTLEAIRGEMRRTDLPYIQDASGPEDGHAHVDAEEIARRRTAFRAAMDGMAKEFRTILNVASLTDCRPGTVCLGRRMETWARGVDMPEPVTLEVQVEDRGRYRVVMPCQREIEALANAGKRVPRLVEGDVRAAREECAAWGWGGERVEKSVGVCGCGGEGKVNSERSTVNSGSGSSSGQGEAAHRNAEGRRDGCEAEMVLRARGMTVVAMPAGWEAGKSVGVGGGGSVCEEAAPRERAATELDGRETGKSVGVGGCGSEGKETVGGGSGKEKGEGKRVGVCGSVCEGTAPRGGTETEPAGGKLRAVRAEAGRERAVVKHPGDRQAIRAAVGRLMAPPNNLSQTEACRQVAEAAVQGRAGKSTLSMSYRLPPDEATPSVIRRTYLADW